MTSPGVQANILGKSLLLSLTALAPLASSFLTISGFRLVYGDHAAVAVGMSGNILGIIIALTAGCMVMSLRTFAKLRAVDQNDSKSLLGALRGEHANAYVVAVIVLLLIGVCSLITLTSSGVRVGPFVYYLLGSLPWLLILPFSQAGDGFLQAFDQDRKILASNVAMLVLHTGIVAVVVTVKPDLTSGLLLVSLGQSLAAVLVYIYRLRIIRGILGRDLGVSFVPQRTFRLSSIIDRMLAGSDGLIYMGFFFLATFVAAGHSPQDGAIIATVVSFMRMLVIPLKQFGLVGGRFFLRSHAVESSPHPILRQAVIPCFVAALIAFGCAYLMVPDGPGFLLGIMVFVQIALEPYSGVTYSMGKVIYGPRAMIGALGICYLALGAPALLLLGVADIASALVVWSCIFVTRLVFTGFVQWRLVAVRSKQAELASV